MRAMLGLATLLLAACGGEPPPDGGLDASTFDAGTPDAGARDAGPPRDGGPEASECTVPPRDGQMGARCIEDLHCERGSGSCVDGATLALDFPTGIPDPDHPGYFLPGPPSTIPVRFAPDGMCTTPCRLEDGDATCGACARCDSRIGGSPAFAEIGIRVGWLVPEVSDLGGGICRGRCVFDAETNGGCPAGFTCDPDSSLCLEGCVEDAQCRLRWGSSAAVGSVALEDGSAVCDAATGRCRWMPPPGAAFGSPCERDEDCPRDVGICLYGSCATQQCHVDGGSRYPCGASERCFESGDDTSICLTTCETLDDCPAPYVCRVADDGGGNVCSPVCDRDAPCRADERCFHVFADPELGRCLPFCDPTAAGLEGAETCAADEACRPVPGEDYGQCHALGGLCAEDIDCVSDQVCGRAEEADMLGHCASP